MEEIDQLHDQKRYKEIFEITQNLVDTQGDSCPHDILWRHARAYYDLSAEAGVSKKKQLSLLRDGQKIVDRCMELDSNNFYSQKWAAVYLSALNDFEGMKTKIQSAFKIKEHCDNANVILGKDEYGKQIMDGTLEHLLGRWCFRIASVTWIERKLASAVITELPDSPEEATYPNALHHFLNADKLKPDFVVNALWCGHTYKKLGDNTNAKKWYRRAMRMKITSSSDKAASSEASKIISKL